MSDSVRHCPPRLRGLGLAVFLAIGARASIAVAQLTTQSQQAPTIAVQITNFAFAPARIEARVGDIIEFINADFVPHTATSDVPGWDTGAIKFGAKARVVVRGSGEVPFHCQYHPAMRAVVVIGTAD